MALHPFPWELDPVEGVMDAHHHLITEAEAVEFVNALGAKAASLHGHLEAACHAYERVTTDRYLLEPTTTANEQEADHLDAVVAAARAAL